MREKPLGFLKIILIFLSVGLAGFTCRETSKSGLPVMQLTINNHKIFAEIANTPPTMTAGLMFRKQMDEDAGMLFVFPDSALRAFWMKNTYIPLSIAFMDEKGVILNILEMPPQTERNFYSKGPAKFALEMNSGWFESRGIKPGEELKGVLDVPPAKN